MPSHQLVTLARQVLGELAGRAAPDSAAAALDSARELGQALEIGEAALAILVARVDCSGVYRDEGYPATASWLRNELGMSHGRASERLVLARQLPRLDRTRQMLADGSLSAAYAREICNAVVRLDPVDTAVAEDVLLGLVESGCGVREVARAATRITDLVRERRGLEPEPEDGRRIEQRSWLRRSRSSQGGAFVQGWLSALDEATFSAIVDPMAKPTDHNDPRDTAERTADALMSALTAGGRAASVTVIADLAALTNDPSPTPQTSNYQPPKPSTSPTSPSTKPSTKREGTSSGRSGARLLNGTALSPAQARRIALAGGINLLLMGLNGQPLYLGRRVRFASPAQRRVLEALYATCAVAGCDIPAQLCEIHHLGGGWKFGTPTDIDRLVPACRFHNAWVEDHADQVTEVPAATGRTHLIIQRKANRSTNARPPRTRPPSCSTTPSAQHHAQGP